ncbi:response regulator transcription factor [Marinilactibacillus psychrotolerans]|uniref:Two-component system response regulator n=1 Tax=Marinilactibacillus psychrotolerans TaxID=191770 RepID=A0AAV3WS67_9LACT|nr:response regulator transcription factor [Marinilactibacillus psychrotolerans]GEL67521.1 DNA-binding response regulator [Marinilactibacillus psychrotolerans]GEQ34279.1 two-component system response regulator [Marinilactibacillus psychrotolerans]GEQ36430.1 two-component system response regulator [Marinilactibacillus psychrotolerans]SDC98076.1 DNA-binding response regulator, OmpR family, contains REC and winged-helix (wHTH) domain [Marinilactibacillus psychrotolerans]
MNILMIEDNESVCEMIEMFFLKEEWEATFVHNGKKGLDTYLNNQNKYDLVVLDIMLPEMDGMTICKEIRKYSTQIPIIMLTAKDTESDEVIGLEIGADDYVTKPFSPLTLVARIKSLKRRANAQTHSTELEDSLYEVETEHLKLDRNTREVLLYDTLLEGLTPKEFDLLYTLANSPRRVFSREQLLQMVWDYEYFGDERTVDAHIKKLRQKLVQNGPQVIHTVWGVGYKFDDTGAID